MNPFLNVRGTGRGQAEFQHKRYIAVSATKFALAPPLEFIQFGQDFVELNQLSSFLMVIIVQLSYMIIKVTKCLVAPLCVNPFFWDLPPAPKN